jgi:hypothetical protein
VVVFYRRKKRRVVNAWTKVKGREEMRGEEGTRKSDTPVAGLVRR